MFAYSTPRDARVCACVAKRVTESIIIIHCSIVVTFIVL
jgi:hypothetical protein